MKKPIALACFLFAALGACSEDPVTTIDRASDCSNICEKADNCSITNYNRDACEDRCKDMTDKDDTARIDECDDCLEERSCTNSVFNCTSECAGIVIP